MTAGSVSVKMTAGLGDWYVNKQKFPNGLDELIKNVNSLGMDFGLWVEPEMVTLTVICTESILNGHTILIREEQASFVISLFSI